MFGIGTKPNLICLDCPRSNLAVSTRHSQQCAVNQFGEKVPWESINWSFAEVIGLRYEYHTSNVSVKLKIHITPTVYLTETTEVQALTEKH